MQWQNIDLLLVELKKTKALIRGNATRSMLLGAFNEMAISPSTQLRRRRGLQIRNEDVGVNPSLPFSIMSLKWLFPSENMHDTCTIAVRLLSYSESCAILLSFRIRKDPTALYEFDGVL